MRLELDNVRHVFSDNGYEALHGVSVHIDEGECVGIVGESGSGKSTLCEVIGGLLKPSAGRALCDGKEIYSLKGDEWRRFRLSVQYIFQDPKASINPYFSLFSALYEPLRIKRPGLRRKEAAQLIVPMLHRLGLDEEILSRRVGEISGGQAQRIVIARSLLMESEVMIADECVSALDLSIQAQIMNIIADIHRQTGTGILFISHDMGLVRWLCDRIYVMLHGRIVEELRSGDLPSGAKSEYTKLLLEASR